MGQGGVGAGLTAEGGGAIGVVRDSPSFLVSFSGSSPSVLSCRQTLMHAFVPFASTFNVFNIS